MPDLSELPRLFITNSGAVSRLEVAGELVVATAGPLRDHLELLVEYGTGDGDIDMGDVSFATPRPSRSSSRRDSSSNARAATSTSLLSPDRSSGFWRSQV